MKGRGREEKRVSLTVRKQSLTAFAPASAAKTTLEFLTASARWSQDEFIRAMHNAKGRDYHIAAALGPWQRRLIGDIEGGPREALVFPLASGEVSVHSWERWKCKGERREGVGGSEDWFTSLQAALPLGQEQARRGLKATHTQKYTHVFCFSKRHKHTTIFSTTSLATFFFFLVMGLAVPTR